jgi:hypothetical protein
MHTYMHTCIIQNTYIYTNMHTCIIHLYKHATGIYTIMHTYKLSRLTLELKILPLCMLPVTRTFLSKPLHIDFTTTEDDFFERVTCADGVFLTYAVGGMHFFLQSSPSSKSQFIWCKDIFPQKFL